MNLLYSKIYLIVLKHFEKGNKIVATNDLELTLSGGLIWRISFTAYAYFR